MASAIENLQLAQSLFNPVRQSVGRYLDTQASIAQQAQQAKRQREMMNLKRLQELEDQAAEANLRTRLTSMTVQGQKDIEASRASRDDARFNAAQTREDAKAAEAEKKANIAAVKAAYAKYQAAGGTEKIDVFGKEDDPNTYYKIQEATGDVVGKREKAQFGQMANLLASREKELSAMVNPTDDEVAAITDQTIQNLALDENLSDAVEMYTKLSTKIDPAVAIDRVAMKYPAFARAVKTGVTAGISALRAEKAKSPEFIRNLQGYQAEKATITKAALDSPHGIGFFEALKTIGSQTETPAKAKNADLSSLDTSKDKPKPKTKTEAAPEAPAAPSGYGGAIGAFEGGAGRLRNLLDIARVTASNVAEPFAATLNYAAGGAKRVGEGFDAREAERQRIINLYNLRNPGAEMPTDPLFAR
jgi:hypothetical protein